MSLTDEQKQVVRQIVKNRGNTQVQTLGGYAGTGKTTVIRTLIQKLDTFAVLAFTGKATNVLRKKGINHASTIHGLIYQPYTYKDADGNEWTEWSRVPDVDVDGFIVDEGSMVSGEIDADLRSYNKPIIYVGDHGQLEPINSDFNIMKNPMYRLEQVHRNAGEIAHFASHLRRGKKATTFKGQTQVQVVTESAIEDRHLAGTDQIICAFNKTRVQLNERVRKQKGINYSYVAVGDRVMCLRNNRKLRLFNGMQGVVEAIHPNEKFTFRTDGELRENIVYDPETFGKEKADFNYRQTANPFDYAYAITAHKSQGDEWGNVIVYEQVCDKWDHTRWAYTAASRAKRGLLWIAHEQFVPKWL